MDPEIQRSPNLKPRIPLTVLALCLSITAFASAAQTAEEQFKSGVALLKGEGAPLNRSKGTKLIEKSAAAGNPRAQVWAALIHERSAKVSEQKKALRWAQKAADQGHPLGQCLVGSHYESGQGVPRDLQLAEDWMTKAANQGQPDAMMNLATLSAQDIGSTPGPAWSYCWTKLAADRHLPYAINTLDRLQALHQDIRNLGEKRAKAFVAKIERPDVFNEDDLKFPAGVRPEKPPVPASSPGPKTVPAAAPSPAPDLKPAAPAASATKKAS